MKKKSESLLNGMQGNILKTIALSSEEVKDLKQLTKFAASTSEEMKKQEAPFVWGWDASMQAEVERYNSIAARLNAEIVSILKKLNLCSPEYIANYISLSRGLFDYSVYRKNLLSEYMNSLGKLEASEAVLLANEFAEIVFPLEESVKNGTLRRVEEYNPNYLIFDGEMFRANDKQIRNDHAEVSTDDQLKTVNWIIDFNEVMMRCPVKMDYYRFLPFIQRQLIGGEVTRLQWWQANYILKIAQIGFDGK